MIRSTLSSSTIHTDVLTPPQSTFDLISETHKSSMKQTGHMFSSTINYTKPIFTSALFPYIITTVPPITTKKQSTLQLSYTSSLNTVQTNRSNLSPMLVLFTNVTIINDSTTLKILTTELNFYSHATKMNTTNETFFSTNKYLTLFKSSTVYYSTKYDRNTVTKRPSTMKSK